MHMKLKTLTLLSLLCSLLCFPAYTHDKLTLALDWYMNPNHALLLTAEAQGYFKEEGIELSFITPVDTTLPLKMLIAGQVDVVVSFEPQFKRAKAQGMPVHWLMTMVNQPLQSILVLKKGRIHSVQDLKGKSLGYSGGASTRDRIEQVLKHENIPLSSLKLINVKMGQTQALLMGRVDAIAGAMRNVEPIELEMRGQPVRIFPFEEHGVPSYAELILAVREGEQDRPVWTRFIHAIERARKAVKADPEGTWRTVAKRFKSQMAHSNLAAETNHKIWLGTVPYF